MLQIDQIKKEYKTGMLVQKALDGVSLGFRDNEFVAVLGPSGSGKTTLLNIIGGLDRYDSGDIILNGVSTKQYSERDWDAYRNHIIGFVFQNYNLIPHQSVLSNVELALTIGGISKTERRNRAQEALEKVGLGDQSHKLPSQLSGGQMQRVAIARALVNDPKILLADEPTGALDTETSVQVLDLLKEVAGDRLVIMVTHNTELAEQYATRIIRLTDGKVISDSDPFSAEEDFGSHTQGSLPRASMSFFTALQLSFKNLLTKKARTILVALAGSIGIIGIALILAASNGVNRYISKIEEDTLSEYPIEITGSSFSLFSLLDDISGFATGGGGEDKDSVKVLKTLTLLLSEMSANDLKALKEWLESGQSGTEPYTRFLRYTYDISPLVFREEGENIKQVNPYMAFASFETDLNGLFSKASGYNASFTQFFHEMPADESLYNEQYEVRAGRWPENANECVVVLNGSNSISDLSVFVLGLADDSEVETAIKDYLATGKIDPDKTIEVPDSYPYEDLLGIKFRLVHPSDCYVYDKKNGIWTSKMENEAFMKDVVSSSEELSVVGVVRTSDSANGSMLHAGINYLPSLTAHIMETAADSRIVKEQLANPDVDVLTGLSFTKESKGDMDLFSLFSLDPEILKDAVSLNPGAFGASGLQQALADAVRNSLTSGNLNLQDLLPSETSLEEMLKMEDILSPEDIKALMPSLSEKDLAELLKSVKVNISREELESTVKKLFRGFLKYVKKHPEADFTRIPDAITDFMESETAHRIITKGLREIIRSKSSELITQEDLRMITDDISEGFKEWSEEHEKKETEQYEEYLTEYLNSDEVLKILEEDLTKVLEQVADKISPEDLNSLKNELLAAFLIYAKQQDLPDAESITKGFLDYLNTKSARKIIQNGLISKIDTTDLENKAADLIASALTENSSVLSSAASKIREAVLSWLQSQSGTIASTAETMILAAITGAGASMNAYLSDLSALERVISFDGDVLKNAVSMNMDVDDLNALLSSVLSDEPMTCEKNLKKFGYADPDDPDEILIYPKDFDSKNALTEILKDYNRRMEESGQEEKIISFSDMMGTMISSVKTIIQSISYVLVAFVSIALVVSSIMIGVITYISVFERKKEIGILRSIGASRRNIASVFNAETIITGLFAGLIGVGLTYLLLIPVNLLLKSLTGQDIAAFLPAGSAALLVLLSIVLTLIGGLIPSAKAAKSDPVTALRNE